MRHRLVLLGMFLLSGLPGFADAARDDRQAIEVSADHLLVEERKDQAVYSGNVVVRRGDLTISAERVVIQGAGKAVQRIVASGSPVKLRQANRRGEGQQLIYEPRRDLITLSGAAHVWQDRNEVAGDRITYYVREQRTEVAGKGRQRVKSVFYSGEEAALPGGDAGTGSAQ